MEDLTNQQLIDALIEAGYNAQIEENEQIEEAVEILNESDDEYAPAQERTTIINWIKINGQVGGIKRRTHKKRQTNKKKRTNKKKQTNKRRRTNKRRTHKK